MLQQIIQLFVITLLLSTALFAAEGDLDLSFNTTGKVTTDIAGENDRAHSIAVQNDGKIVVAGYRTLSGGTSFALLRYENNGSLDNSFGTSGKVITSVGLIDYGYSTAIQSDGKILVTGTSYISANYDISLLRYNTNGTLDSTFDSDGIVTTPIGSATDTGYSVVIQSDNKIIVAGYSYNGSDFDFAVVRYNSDGSLDTTFSSDGKVTTDLNGNDHAYDVALQNDGKIVVVGESDGDFAIVRYNSNGSLDTSFNSTGKVITDLGTLVDNAKGIVIQQDGKIVVAGSSSDKFAVVRYNIDGTLDTSFDTDGIATIAIGNYYSYCHNVLLQSNNKIILSGQSYNYDYSSSGIYEHNFALIRYNHNGSIDTSFGANGIILTDIEGRHDKSYASAIQNDGNIILVGSANIEDTNVDEDFALVRYHANPLIIAPVISYLLD